MFEAYKVAVRLSVMTNAAEVLGMMVSRLRGVGTEAELTAKKLGLIGAATAATGFAGLKVLGKTVDAAKDYAHQLSLVNTLGLKHAEVTAIINKSWETSRQVVTTTAAENLQAIRELRSAFGAGQEDHALAVLPTVQRAKAILTALTGKEQEHVGFDMVKAIELRSTGGMTEATVIKNAELMVRTLIGMGGTLNVNDFHQTLKYAKQPAMKWNDEFTYEYLPTFMQEMKAGKGGSSSAGTSLRTFDKTVHGRITKAAQDLWIDSGLLAASDIVKNSTGHWQVKPGAVKGLGLEEESPYRWVQEYLAPAIAKVTAQRHVSEETAINAMFNDPNSAFAAYTFYKKATQFERDKKLINQSNSMEAYDKLLKADPVLAEQALHKQWQNMLAILGYQIMPDLLRGTGWLIEKFRDLTGWFRKNEGLAKGIVIGFAGLSAVMAVGGTLLTGIAVTRIALGGLGTVLGGGGTAAAAGGGLASNIGALAGGLKVLGLAAAPLLTMLAVKEWAEDTSHDQERVGTLRGLSNKVKSLFGDPTASARERYMHSRSELDGTSSEYVRAQAQQAPRMINNTIMMPDGRVLAEVVTKEQAKEASRPISGMRRPDPSMSPIYPGHVMR